MLRNERRDPPENVATDYVFVYGTLMSGQCRFHVLVDYLLGPPEPAVTSGRLVDLGSYPGLLPCTDLQNDLVAGELMTVKNVNELLVTLDAIEGYSFGNDRSLYRRERVGVKTADRRTDAWTYFYNQTIDPSAIWIEHGDWRAHCRCR